MKSRSLFSVVCITCTKRAKLQEANSHSYDLEYYSFRLERFVSWSQ